MLKNSALLLASLLLAPLVHAGESDWPWWRGPTRDGVAPAGQTPPLTWSATENVIWQAPVPGRGHGAPTVVGDRVFLAAADPQEQVQWMLGFDRKTGRQLWQTEIHRGGFDPKGNAKNTQASSTPACDGERVYVNFLNGGGVVTTALDLDGKKLWQTKISDFVQHQGFGTSPAIYQSLVLVSSDNKGGGAVAGLDRATGKIVWKRDRPKLPNYTSPIVLPIAGRDVLLMTGCDLVTALDPLTGKELWESKGATTECVTSVISDGKLVFTSGGYPKNHMSAMKADGSGTVAWEHNTRMYVPSFLVRGNHLYGVTDAGFATCWDAATGKEVWKERLSGAFSASPVLVNDMVYATSETGKTYVFKAVPDGFTLLAENQLGDETMATPVLCGSRLYTRVAVKSGGKRQELLYCIGKP